MNVIDLLMILTFVIGYTLITLEHLVKINKSSIALMMAIICWSLEFTSLQFSHSEHLSALSEHLAGVSQVVFFLFGALVIVEIINAHRGFKLISNYIRVRSKVKLLWSLGFLTFFLSAILDNLTTTIVMVTLLSKLVKKGEDRLLLGGAIVIAANAGGAWTPIGDVTTTMLWIGGQLSSYSILTQLFLPSLACLVLAFSVLSLGLKGSFEESESLAPAKEEPFSRLIFWSGLLCLIFVPIFKAITGLPPFMGIILGMALLWLITDIVHRDNDERSHLRVPHIITKIDVSSVLFFLGILLCIDALHTAGILDTVAKKMDEWLGNASLIAVIIGLASAVVDNVPLVAASMGMYSLSVYPQDANFWNLIAFCAGTGGSILVIGSAAGVAFMGLEKVDFFWYFRRVGIPALVGYFGGIGIYLLQTLIH